MRPIVAPPKIVREEFSDCLPIEHRVNVEVVYRTGPDGLGWRDISAMLVLYGNVVEVRV